MSELLLAFTIFLIFTFLMSLGYILRRKSIQGSCGGINALGMDKVCDCEEPCARKKAEIKKQQVQQNNPVRLYKL